jgi:endoribonuclease Dicer
MDRLEENEVQRREMEEIINVLKVRYFRSSDFPLFEKKKMDYLVHKCETNSDALVYYRKLNEKYGLKINLKESPFIMVLQTKSIVNDNFTYNCHFSLKHANHSFKQMKKKLKTDASIHSILPTEVSKIYFLSKKHWKLATRLPSILIQFERFILVHQMIKSMKLLTKPPTEQEVKHFTAALTSPAMIEDYSYEILETLGDSVLKFMVTYYLFDKFPHHSEGDISKRRNELTKNNYLFQKGSQSTLVNYIYASPFNMKNWDPPLKFKHLQKYELTVTKKSMADVVEAVMGACFLSSELFNSCLIYFKYIDILNGNSNFSPQFLQMLQEFEKTTFIDLSFNSISYEADISFIDLFNCFSLYNEDFQPETLKNSKQTKEIGINFKGIDYANSAKVYKIFSNLEEKILNYKFKDKSLLKEAMTHKSINPDRSYERLEILGDAILEVYIMTTIFHLSEKKLNLDSSFNPGNLSKIKAFLSSNYFLLRLSVFFKLYEFMMVSAKLGRKIEDANKYIKGINFSQKLNEYENTILGRPKIVSDIFESILGAIFIDSNLNQCFAVLNILLGPFVVYCAKYLGKLKYSPIAEFVEHIQEHFKKGPTFTAKKAEEGQIEVQITVDNKVLGKGKGLNEDAAKEAACLNGLKKIKNLK